MTHTLVVSEVFGPTFQGEGPHLGQRVAFVRLGACNLTCSWCDTPYTWDADRYDLHDELTRVPVAEVVDQVAAMQPYRVVISGGEPLLWQRKAGWEHLLEALAHEGLPVEVETNGTLVPDLFTTNHVAHFNVSPKLAHSGDPESARIKPAALQVFAQLASRQRACLKIVVQTPDDVATAAALAGAVGFPRSAVYVMPEGTDTATLVQRHRELAEAVMDHGINITTRLHVLTWGEERGR